MELKIGKLFLLCLLIALSRGQEDWECSEPCKCKWVSGKKTAECIKRNLTDIPYQLSPEIQNLDLTGNKFKSISSNAFSEVSLVNLHKLVLRNCDIEVVHTYAFNGLRIVIEIDLSDNNITTLHPGTFKETQRLRVLLLDNNRLKVLENGLFRDLMYLQKVVLSNNALERIEEKAFYNLSILHTLTLSGNNLSTLKVQSFEDLPKLGSLELHNNPWNCNCRLKKFRDWSIRRKLYTRPTTCEQPAKLAGKDWDDVSSDEFACRPEILAIGPSTRIEISNGDVTLHCRASGIPQPQLSWIHHKKTLSNDTRRLNKERGYLIRVNNEWTNLTIPDITISDKGEYICLASNPGGIAEKNVTVLVAGDSHSSKDSVISWPLATGLGVVVILVLMTIVTLSVCCCRRRKTQQDEKSIEAASLERHGLGEQEKSLITAINPFVKPPRRYEAPSVTSHGTEMTELNRTLLDNDSVFADGVGGGVVGGMMGSATCEDEHEDLRTAELDGTGGTLPRGATGYRQYPPDLLAFSGVRGASPTSQASTAPDNTRLPNQHGIGSAVYGSPSGQYPAAFKTLPHNRSVTPYAGGTTVPVMARHGYVTIPRRPRAPSWSSGPPISPSAEPIEPVYDNLGVRSTADGSSLLSLNKSPEPTPVIRRPLPDTPTSNYSTVLQRSTPNILTNSPYDRAAPEGAPEWPSKLLDESTDCLLGQQSQHTPGNNTLGRKVPPRPPPKPKKKSANGPLYEDEGEDGTEV